MRSFPAALLVALTAFAPPAAGQPQRPDAAVAAAQNFLAAVRRGDCNKAWSYFSAATQIYIEQKSQEMIRSAPYYADSFSPRNLYCKPTSVHRFHGYDPKSARLHAKDGANAVVALDRHEGAGFRLPGFFPTRTEIFPAELQLVQESGAWKIVLP